jgi:hypothetical protein
MHQIASAIEEAWSPDYSYIGILIDMDAVRALQVGNVIWEKKATHTIFSSS